VDNRRGLSVKIVMIDSLISNDYTFWLCRGLARDGVDVTLITTENRKDMTEKFTVLPVSPAKGAGQNKLVKFIKYIRFLYWLFFYVKNSQADIIHYQFFRRERIECLYFPLLRLIHKHVFFTAHNILPHEHNFIDYYLRSLVYKSASNIIVHTTGSKDRLLQLFKVNPDKVDIVPAVKPTSGVRNSSVTRAAAREWLHLSPDEKVLLFFGFIREYKGLDLLLAAFDIARANHEGLKLVIAGKPQTPELLERYQTQIRQMKYGDSVIFKAEFIPNEDVDYYFRAADALAVPYKRIDLSGVLQEAFTYSLPVLATNVGNFKELIQPSINGYITENNTPQEFAQLINEAFQDMSVLTQMGKAAFAIDQNYPSWEKIGMLTSELYRESAMVH
jgi:D-inositol-3-phosphate glycosyltransferase